MCALPIELQGTRPQTLGIAMSDSPVGVAAWILEKFGVWADVPRRADGSPDLWQAFDEDTLLTNIMLYVAPQAFVTSTWMYRGWVLEKAGKFPPNTRVRVPPGIAARSVGSGKSVSGRVDLGGRRIIKK